MLKTDLAQKIRTLADLTDAERSDLLALLNEQKKYGLVWEEKPEQVEEDLRDKLPVLREVADRRITARRSQTDTVASSPSLSATPNQLTIDLLDAPADLADTVTPDTITNTAKDNNSAAPHHLLIEGDNLHALTVLNYTHAGKVDVIYIDPPYNTGNKDFKYNDRFIDREDSYRHSKWLSFMHKRLELACNLLKPEGVIFISIDDNEQAQLKLLCNEVFGEENFVANIVWKKKTGSGKQISKVFSEHEYVITFSKKNSINVKWRVYNDSDGNFQNPDADSRGSWESCAITAPSKNKNPNQLYQIEVFYDAKKGESLTGNPVIAEFEYLENYIIISKWDNANIVTRDIYDSNRKYTCHLRRWAYVPSSILAVFEDSRVYLKEGNLPRYKKFEDEYDGKALRSVYFDDFSTQKGSDDLSNVIQVEDFDYPKPLDLIKHLIKPTSSKNALILDFFAGSGTTLHAVMALNAEDGGNRQCILVTNNENNIAEEVCYERNRRVIDGYTNGKGVDVPGLTNNHLHYYQTTYVGRERTQPNKRALMQLATELLCIKEVCFNPVETPYSTAPADPSIRLFTNDPTTQYVVIVYDEDAIEDAVTLIQSITPTVVPVKVYVFAPGPYPYTDDFEDVLDRIELCALPEALYQAYGRLLPPQGKPKTVDTEADLSTDPQQMTLPLNV